MMIPMVELKFILLFLNFEGFHANRHLEIITLSLYTVRKKIEGLYAYFSYILWAYIHILEQINDKCYSNGGIH